MHLYFWNLLTDSCDKLYADKLPSQEEFYSILAGLNCSDKDRNHYTKLINQLVQNKINKIHSLLYRIFKDIKVQLFNSFYF